MTSSDDPTEPSNGPGSLDLGAFSVSLTVADLQASREFYEKLGFAVSGGDAESHYLILANGEAIIGLFQGMFDRNILTFNPGLNNRMEQLDSYTDVRAIRASLEAAGLTPEQVTEPADEGPASFVVVDPDGNPVLVDQFF